MSDEIDLRTADLERTLERIGEVEPLVQALTNEVTMNDVANVLLYWDGLPVMADSPGDAGEMARAADAIAINSGQIPERKVEAMLEAGEVANDRGVPVVLDPVGVGSTPSRQAVAERLLSAIEFDVIKGNYGEISALAGVDAEVRGVESVGEYEEIDAAARSLAASTGAVVVASGVEDVVADENSTYSVSAGHEMMSEFVGTGCLLGATLAVFCGALEDASEAAVRGTLAFGLAGEIAAESGEYCGPASYRTRFLDTVATLPARLNSVELEGRLSRSE